jgi:hypothetical protein
MIILGGTYAIGERKMQSIFLDIELHLQLKTNSCPPMHHLWFGIDRYIFKVQTLQVLEFMLNYHPPKPTSKEST